MSTISEQLGELLKSYEEAKGTKIYRVVEIIFRDTLSHALPKFITEYEKLEREAEAGTNIRNELKKRVSEMELNKEVLPPEFFNGYRQAYAEMDRTADHIYRTTCEK